MTHKLVRQKNVFWFRKRAEQVIKFVSKKIFFLFFPDLDVHYPVFWPPSLTSPVPSSLSVLQHMVYLSACRWLLSLSQDGSLALLATFTLMLQTKLTSSQGFPSGEPLRYFPPLSSLQRSRFNLSLLDVYICHLFVCLILPVDYKLWRSSPIPFLFSNRSQESSTY